MMRAWSRIDRSSWKIVVVVRKGQRNKRGRVLLKRIVWKFGTCILEIRDEDVNVFLFFVEHILRLICCYAF